MQRVKASITNRLQSEVAVSCILVIFKLCLNVFITLISVCRQWRLQLLTDSRLTGVASFTAISRNAFRIISGWFYFIQLLQIDGEITDVFKKSTLVN